MALDTLAVLTEYAQIRRGEHPGWSGDPVLNGEAFARRVGRDFGPDAYALCADVEAHVSDLSDLTGLPPSSVKRFLTECRKAALSA